MYGRLVACLTLDMLNLPLQMERAAAGHGVEDNGKGMVVPAPPPCVYVERRGLLQHK